MAPVKSRTSKFLLLLSSFFALPFAAPQVFSAETTTLPIEAHSLQQLPPAAAESSSPPPSRHILRTSARRSLYTPKQVVRDFSSNDPENFELAGLKLGMNFNQVRLNMAANLGLTMDQIRIVGPNPVSQHCTQGTSLSGENENGEINVQFACNAGLSRGNELSASEIIYEPAYGTVQQVLRHAIRRYGDPVNLADVSPRADYVTYDWCLNPVKDISSETGESLYCPAKNGSRLRLKGRDNGLELILSGLVGAARNYDGGSNPVPEDDGYTPGF